MGKFTKKNILPAMENNNVMIIYMFFNDITVRVVAEDWLNVTSNYTALMSDLRIDLLESGVAVQLYELQNDNYTLMGTITVDENWPNVTLHCGIITKGGRYVLQLVSNNTTEDNEMIQVFIRCYYMCKNICTRIGSVVARFPVYHVKNRTIERLE
jgi:hypothetical protein